MHTLNLTHLLLILNSLLLIALLLKRPQSPKTLETQLQQNHSQHLTHLQQLAHHQQQQLHQLREHTQTALHTQQTHLNTQIRNELSLQLNHQRQHLSHELKHLTSTTETHLQHISAQVEQRLNQGFHNTQSIFQDVISRLSRIDEAQKRIHQLSSDVTSLRDLLSDKRSRGAFGEIQLKNLIDNVLPPQNIRYQATLSNGKRPDCLILLPQPSGNIAIDAKFPLESYRALHQDNQTPSQKQHHRRQLHQDVKKHIKDIAEKYILPPETANGAILFIPAEAIFAELHAHHAELIEQAYQLGVWLTSPATLMAVLTTAKSVIKDDATRQQAHQLRQQLYHLNHDFQKFQQKMDALARHIDQASKDVADVQHSAQKITTRFQHIENTPSDFRPSNND